MSRIKNISTTLALLTTVAFASPACMMESNEPSEDDEALESADSAADAENEALESADSATDAENTAKGEQALTDVGYGYAGIGCDDCGGGCDGYLGGVGCGYPGGVGCGYPGGIGCGYPGGIGCGYPGGIGSGGCLGSYCGYVDAAWFGCNNWHDGGRAWFYANSPGWSNCAWGVCGNYNGWVNWYGQFGPYYFGCNNGWSGCNAGWGLHYNVW